MRYIAVDNTNAVEYGGWELVDTLQTPPHIIAICMPKDYAIWVAVLLNDVGRDH
jgi:hypothetical protein